MVGNVNMVELPKQEKKKKKVTCCPASQQDVGAPNVITALCGWSFLGVVWNNGSSKLHREGCYG